MRRQQDEDLDLEQELKRLQGLAFLQKLVSTYHRSGEEGVVRELYRRAKKPPSGRRAEPKKNGHSSGP